MKRYNIYIETSDKSIKLYWNCILQTWTQRKGNASPLRSEDISDKPLPFNAQIEEAEEIAR